MSALTKAPNPLTTRWTAAQSLLSRQRSSGASANVRSVRHSQCCAWVTRLSAEDVGAAVLHLHLRHNGNAQGRQVQPHPLHGLQRLLQQLHGPRRPHVSVPSSLPQLRCAHRGPVWSSWSLKDAASASARPFITEPPSCCAASSPPPTSGRSANEHIGIPLRSPAQDCVDSNATGTMYIGELCRYLLNTKETPAEKQHKVSSFLCG